MSEDLELYKAEADAIHQETIALLKEIVGAPIDQRQQFMTRFMALQQRLGNVGWSMIEGRTGPA
jgi:hypothetical protein